MMVSICTRSERVDAYCARIMVGIIMTRVGMIDIALRMFGKVIMTGSLRVSVIMCMNMVAVRILCGEHDCNAGA